MRRVVLAVGLFAALVPATAHATDRFNSTPYRKAVTVPNILLRETALQDIADRSGTGNRVAGYWGYVQQTTAAAIAAATQTMAAPTESLQYGSFIIALKTEPAAGGGGAAAALSYLRRRRALN